MDVSSQARQAAHHHSRPPCDTVMIRADFPTEGKTGVEDVSDETRHLQGFL